MHFCQDEVTGLVTMWWFVPHVIKCAWWKAKGWVK